MILKMGMKSKFILRQPRYYNSLTERQDTKIYVFKVIFFFFFENILLVLQWISKNSLQTPSLDKILGKILQCQIQLF